MTRRNLPHWYVPGAAHFVTHRLAGSIPQAFLQDLREERARLLKGDAKEGWSEPERREHAHKRFFAQYDHHLDTVCEIDWLATPEVAARVRANLHHHHGTLYHLIAYCIMPNHVHLLLQPMDSAPDGRGDGRLACRGPAVPGEAPPLPDELPDRQSPLARTMHSLKSYTAHEANKLLGRSGQFWQPESYDHWVRDDAELSRIVEYICCNPVDAGLAGAPHEWSWGSAHDRFLADGSTLGVIWLP